MYLELLQLRNYRNYARLELRPSPGLNVFLGRNGQGKTNLLEAVALLALSSSPRTRRDCELVGGLANEARVEGWIQARDRRAQVSLAVACVEERSRRSIEVNGAPTRAVDLPGALRVTLFWPEDLNLVKSGPEHRRRFLNQMLVQVEPGYARTLSRYSRSLEQRNHLLRLVGLGERPDSELQPWDEQLAELGSRLVNARSTAVADLAELARARHAELAPGEELEVEYLGPPPDLAAALADGRREDVRRGTTTVGPQRDDVLLKLNGREARSFASQGQQRTAVVSLKLAEASLVEKRAGEPPALLLDDVLSELDLQRRGALLQALRGTRQVIITSVDAAPFPGDLMHEAEVLCINAGRLGPCA